MSPSASYASTDGGDAFPTTPEATGARTTLREAASVSRIKGFGGYGSINVRGAGL
jgi:hypothetical protein